jgi:hypothetical protein
LQLNGRFGGAHQSRRTTRDPAQGECQFWPEPERLLTNGTARNRTSLRRRPLKYLCSRSIANEKVKAAYRLAYSLFDKIAFFLNAYLNLKLDESRIYFRGVWYVNADRKQGIRPELDRSENWPLRGLYWLAKDHFDKDFHDVTEPDAQTLYAIRNQLEHRYLKVHEIYSSPASPTAADRMWIDDLAYSIQREDFEAKTLRVLRHARAGLVTPYSDGAQRLGRRLEAIDGVRS